MHSLNELVDLLDFGHALEQRRFGHFNHEAGRVEGPFSAAGLDFTPTEPPEHEPAAVFKREVDPETGAPVYRLVK